MRISDSPETCLINSLESTNRFGQVSGTTDASKTQLGLIRVERTMVAVTSHLKTKQLVPGMGHCCTGLS
jgi:hypothetical protein